MKYIIFGHAGLIGKPLKERLDRLGECVGCFDPRDIKNKPLNASKKIDICFDLSANCKINKCIEEPPLAFENTDMINDSLEICRAFDIPKIVYFSSSRVLSKEMNPYTESKRYGENLCKAYQKCYGIKYLIIRPSTVYGGEDKTNRLMNIWINKAIKGEPLDIYGSTNKTLDFTYIDDFLDAFFLVLDKDNQEFNISGGEELKLVDVAKEIIKQSKSESKIYQTDKETQQPQKVSIDITPLEKLGYKPKVSLKQGIKREIERCQN